MSTPDIVVPPRPALGTAAPIDLDQTARRRDRRRHHDFRGNRSPWENSYFHLHHDSDETAYVLNGEVTFKIGDEVTVAGPGSCTFMPRGVPHAWKEYRRGNRSSALSIYAGQSRRVDRRAAAHRLQIRIDE